MESQNKRKHLPKLSRGRGTKNTKRRILYKSTRTFEIGHRLEGHCGAKGAILLTRYVRQSPHTTGYNLRV